MTETILIALANTPNKVILASLTLLGIVGTVYVLTNLYRLFKGIVK